jgi:peptidoglycan/LPS O-acetylase OafA/YrhL
MKEASAHEERRTSGGVPVVGALDGFRAYAILCVICVHLLWFSGALDAIAGTTAGLVTWSLASNSIDVLFIVSGFVLFLPTVTRRGTFGDVKAFARGRAARLVPAYWLVLAVLFLLIAFIPTEASFAMTTETSVAMPSLTDVAAHMTFLQMPAKLLDSNFLIGFGIDGPLWLLSVMVGFYLLLPVIAGTYYRHPLLGLAIAAAITFAWKSAVLEYGTFFAALGGGTAQDWVARLVATDQLPGWLFSFALGMTAAWAYVRLLERQPRTAIASRAAVVAVLALPVYALFAYLYGRAAHVSSGAISGSVARLSPWAMIGNSGSRAVLMAAVALGPYWMLKPFVNRPTRWLADLSYSTYLIHLAVGVYAGLLLGLPTDGSPLAIVLWFAIVLPLSIGYAYLSVRFVERPVRRWAQTRDRRAKATQPPVPIGRLAEGSDRPG